MDYKSDNNDNDNAYTYSHEIISTNINNCLFSSTTTSPPHTPTSATATATATTNGGSTVAGAGLYRARLILENQLYNELLNRYRLAITRLRQLSREAAALKEENEWLRLANEDLSRRLNPNRVQPCLVGPFTGSTTEWSSSSSSVEHVQNNNGGSSVEYNSPTSVIDDDDDDDHDHDHDNHDDDDDERISLPKSISVRSPGFFKLVKSPTVDENQSQSPSRLVNGTRLKVRKEEKAIEMEVFNQGMYKTELCNKWQETGTCTYGQHCQFAHGISELRPVIRHPRYKTQVCRMVVAGVTCPYGHRCHFRHSLS